MQKIKNSSSIYEKIKQESEKELLERFIRYAEIETTSDSEKAETTTPSTPGQFELLELLKSELEEIGVSEAEIVNNGYLIAYLPGNTGNRKDLPVIGFMAHVDTSSDAPGKNVKPVIHREYDGKIIKLKDGVELDPEENSLLKNYIGETIITSDGTTLLGADDKAGIAEIVTAVKWLVDHPEIPRGDLEIFFTPDEETGMGMNKFPIEKIKSSFCYTVDGGKEGEIESECYYAMEAKVNFNGKVIHPGAARGKLVNAVTMAGLYISLLPRNESPEATDGRYGNYWAHSVKGTMESAETVVFYRSFELSDINRRTEALKVFAKTVEASFPGSEVTVKVNEQYRNMREKISKYPQVMEKLRKAVKDSGIQPYENPIRGGTDGSRLTEMGIPAPNIFTGGMNFHSRYEWAALPAMLRTVAVIVNLAENWTN